MGNACRGEDIASETFLRVLKLPDLGGVREPRAFLTTIAKRLILDNWRREDLERAYLQTLATEPANTLADPEEHAVLLETLCHLDRLLDGLPAKAKTAFVYSQFGGQTYEQIALRLGISRSRVHQYMEQAFLCCLEVLDA
ncbi:RNA polymerase sigma-70 factor, ECF subfamily [Pseudomonas flavescens]|uniref:RNA polymerase sigma-70 factor, ECF subfamily n=2 Tax=Phytopseudomonas flavescens TaxID=29435 RepID=A0A1G8KU58_9GAMM|nr:RNA polymerase sigma-70 factor, ECF subfamily [Pseudomonas flavescens]